MLELKRFYKRIETVFSHIDASASWLAHGLARLLERLGQPLGLRAAHLYKRCEPGVELHKRWGEGQAISRMNSRGVCRARRMRHHDLPWAGETAAGQVGLLPVDDANAWMLRVVRGQCR
jgi:hypothetical protein